MTDMTELEQFKEWVRQTKRYLKEIKGVEKIKEQLEKSGYHIKS